MGSLMEIAEVIRPENVARNLAAPSKTRLLRTLSAIAGKALGADADAIFAALENREKLGSTGIGAGIAIPHAPVAGLTVPYGFIATLAKPIEFEAIDDAPVDIVCLLLTPLSGESDSLSLLSRIARQLRSPEVAKAIRSAPDEAHIHAGITGRHR